MTNKTILATLIIASGIVSLALATVLLQLTSVTEAYNEPSPIVEVKPEPKEVRIITTSEWEEQQYKAAVMADLRHCESTGDDYASGDNGASHGPFQWQKPTFEDKIGRKVSFDYYYDYVTDYDRIYKLTEEVFFEQGEWDRWYNCAKKIGYVE